MTRLVAVGAVREGPVHNVYWRQNQQNLLMVLMWSVRKREEYRVIPIIID